MADMLKVDGLKVHFPIKKGIFARTVGYVKAVDGVSFVLRRGETLGVVGESGSGKSTIARVVCGLVAATEGSVELGGRVAMVFQDPQGSLNPRQNVETALSEVLRISGMRRSPKELMTMVGLGEDALLKYPHEFSGGERQRICIARAIAADPQLLICDEAVSALDLSIRSQILELINELKRKLGLSILFITHDLGVVKCIASSIIVMKNGRIVERGECNEVLASPTEEYTRRLIAAVPRVIG
jgi:ABC-type glutathione transport system ATPase component